MPVKFNTFTGIAFAGLEILPETLQDRSIGLPLHKATREEKPEHLANGYSPVLIECRRKFARWAADLTELPAVTMPPELFNRTGDNWRGLFSIAEAAGGEWPELRQAGGDGGAQRGGQQPHPATAGGDLADLRREEGRAHAHEGPAGRADENRGGAVGGGEQRPRDRRLLAAGKAQGVPAAARKIPKRRRRSAAPANGGRGKARARKGYTEDHLREAWRRYLDRKTPSETAKAPAGAAQWRPGHRCRPADRDRRRRVWPCSGCGGRKRGRGPRHREKAAHDLDRRGGGPARARRSRRA